MKKTVIILVLVLVGVSATLALVSSNDEYAAERILYHAMKTNSKILKNPDVAPPGMLASVEADLKKILTRYPKTGVIKMTHFTLAEFYLANKKFDKAISLLNEIIGRYKNDVLMISRAQFLKGYAYEAQDKWPAALKEYTILKDKYSFTTLGLQMPLYIGKHYMTKGMKEKAANAYEEAASFYRKIEARNKGKRLGYAAAAMLMQAYMNLGRFEQAGMLLERTIDNYPFPAALQELLPMAEIIFAKALRQPRKAAEVFRKIKDKFKDPKVRQMLENRIKTFEKENLTKVR